jgi:predicted nucleic-acid-binding protein
MTGLDTNVLVRFIVRDDPVQVARADALLDLFTQEMPGFISLVAFAELFWVLNRVYRMPKSELTRCLWRLLNSGDLRIENHACVYQALQRYEIEKVDFADCLIERLNHAAGCRETFTFDENAAQHAGMKLL